MGQMAMARSDTAGKLTEYRRKRDFERTREPAGGTGARLKKGKKRRLGFVIQKHRATALHFDLRLELDGVMKSWAVPKGPSLDPAVKRLAMEVEDHPMEYNTFEGTIPQGEYGGGTVMLWDRGTYRADEAGPDDDEQAVLRREHAAGKMSVTFEGERLRGSFALVRTGRGPKPKWLLIKHRDEDAERGSDIVAEHVTSVETGRTMEEIAGDDESAVWHSDRDAIEPMEADAADALPSGRGWRYEPLYDGTRVLAYVTPESHRLVPGSGRSLDDRLPEIAGALRALATRTGRSFVLDGVATGMGEAEPVLYVFDLLLDDGEVIVGEPWTERRTRLEALFHRRRVPHVKLATVWTRGGAAVLDRAEREGWSGVVAKRANAPYRAGERSDDWRRVDS
jgi:bifunctional non-homologous end joining protein LigD